MSSGAYSPPDERPLRLQMLYEWTMDNPRGTTAGQPIRPLTVAQALAACETIGRDLNVIVETLPVDSRAAGMPIAVKDVIDIAGSLTTMGSHVRPEKPATTSAAVIDLCERLGMVPVAKTTCQEHSYGIMGEESTHGRGVNPIWPGYTTGGSSYGSALAVAAGIVPAALGTDTAGSVRVPAACAGIVGFKPTLGRLPTAGVAPLSDSFDTIGLFTRTPAELAALWPRFAAVCPGPVPGQATVPAAEVGDQRLQGLASDEGRRVLRIGVFVADDLGAGAHPGDGIAHDRTWFEARVRPWLEQRCAAAAAEGWQIEIVDLTGVFDLPAMAQSYSTVRARESWLIHRPAWEAGRRDYQPQVRANIEHDQTVSAADYERAKADCAELRAAAAEVFARVDVILTPTMGCQPVPWEAADQGVRWAFRAYTQLFNVLGWPAVSVPIDALPRLLPGADGQVRAQFPASVQIAAAPWQDSALVDIVARIVAAGADEARGDGASGDHASAAGTRGDEANGDGANGGEGAAGAGAGQGPVEQVVLVSDDGAALGAADKATVHTADTPLHQAFSCFVFDTAGRVLLTRRALSKKTWPGVWTNALCGHPGPGEPLAAAVHRRAAEELGCRLGDLTTVLPAYRYRATDASGVVENEICPVFTAVLTGDLDPAADEVAEYDWVEPEQLDAAVAGVPFMFSPWMQEEWQLLRAATGAQQG